MILNDHKKKRRREMKLRRIVVTLEVETTLPMNIVRSSSFWDGEGYAIVQTQANVIKDTPQKPQRKRDKARAK
jgi:hypothetical protein